jgi:hypothetical protein
MFINYEGQVFIIFTVFVSYFNTFLVCMVTVLKYTFL